MPPQQRNRLSRIESNYVKFLIFADFGSVSSWDKYFLEVTGHLSKIQRYTSVYHTYICVVSMETYNSQCLVIQSTSDAGMLSLLPEMLFFYLGSSATMIKIFVGFHLGYLICTWGKDILYVGHFVLDWVVGGIQSYIICSRQYLKTVSKQDSYMFYPKIRKHAVVWHLKLNMWKINDTSVMRAKVSIQTMFYAAEFILYLYLLIGMT